MLRLLMVKGPRDVVQQQQHHHHHHQRRRRQQQQQRKHSSPEALPCHLAGVSPRLLRVDELYAISNSRAKGKQQVANLSSRARSSPFSDGRVVEELYETNAERPPIRSRCDHRRASTSCTSLGAVAKHSKARRTLTDELLEATARAPETQPVCVLEGLPCLDEGVPSRAPTPCTR